MASRGHILAQGLSAQVTAGTHRAIPFGITLHGKIGSVSTLGVLDNKEVVTLLMGSREDCT